MTGPTATSGPPDLGTEVSVLGSLDVRVDGQSVVPTAPKPRVLLGMLAANVDTVVSLDKIVTEIWGRCAPRRDVETVQTYILQIRNEIARPGRGREHAKHVLAHVEDGYRLNSGGGFVDVVAFDELGRAGRAAMTRGDFHEASELFRRALRTWRGTPLVDVAIGPQLAVEVARLELGRHEVLASLIEVDLRLGRFTWWSAELAVLTDRELTNERLQCLYMLVLLASGRRDRALEVYARLYAALGRELSRTPSAGAQHVQRLVLGGTATPADLEAAIAGLSDCSPTSPR